MNNFFSIKQAADIVYMSTETLRHYDRLGLVKPCYIDEHSGYRYYSEHELIQLQTVDLLKTMDLSLMEIKDVLQKNDLTQIISLLKQAEKSADDKIERLKFAKIRIKRAYMDYENKLNRTNNRNPDLFLRHLPERVILLSHTMESPTLKNLWNYQSSFYNQIDPSATSEFSFEDQAGMVTVSGRQRMFVICVKYPSLEGLTVLPAGDYLCADCTTANDRAVLERLLRKAEVDYHVKPEVILHSVVVTGILQWDYQIQILVC